jgi:hypothetical protein
MNVAFFLTLSPAISFTRRQAWLAQLNQILKKSPTLVRLRAAVEELCPAAAAQKGACGHFGPGGATGLSVQNLIVGDQKW